REAEKDIFEHAHNVRSSHHARNRKSVAHRFAKTSQVWSHTKLFLRAPQPEVKTTADLVEDEQCPMLMRQFFHAFEKACRRRPEVHRLHDDCGELAFAFVQKFSQRSQIVVDERMRQSPHRLRNARMARRAANVPILPSVVTAAGDALAPGEGSRSSDCS